MSNCHSKYSTRNDDELSVFLGLIDDFVKKHPILLHRRNSAPIYPLNYFFSKPYNFYGQKMLNIRKNLENRYVTIRSYDKESVRRRVRRKIKLIRAFYENHKEELKEKAREYRKKQVINQVKKNVENMLVDII